MQKRRYMKTKLLEEYLRNNGMTKEEFCKKFDVETSELNMFFDDNKFIEMRTLIIIANTINVRLCDLVFDEN